MSRTETRSCARCQTSFKIAPEDFVFYTKIAVPPPTWCPDCRAARRMAWRNEWHLMKKSDAKTGEEIFSAFSASSPVTIYAPEHWHSDAWDAGEYGRDYDWNRPFLEQFRDLLHTVPLIARPILEAENSDYSLNVGWVKNCYLVASSIYTQDSAYLVADTRSRNCFDNHTGDNNELCYGSLNLIDCYQSFFSVNCVSCRDVVLSRDCVGCSNCFGCANLRNKQYSIFNKPYSKAEYEAKLAEFKLGSDQSLRKLTKQAHAVWLREPVPYMVGDKNEDVSGDYLYECKQAYHCWRTSGLVDGKHCQMTSNLAHDQRDTTGCGSNTELVYESVYCGDRVYNTKFSWYCVANCQNLQYSAFCLNSRDLFGCVGLRHKQYCILNRQYTKEEYERLVPKIISHMTKQPYTDAQGRTYPYGEFFPLELSPFEYNLTFAQEEFPQSEAEVQAQGGRWYHQPRRTTPIEIETTALPDDIALATPSLAGQVIACAHGGTCGEECTTAFTIIPQELAFLIEQGLPLPRLCPNCRHYGRIKERRPMRLHARQCACVESAHGHPDRCAIGFETSFDPSRPEIVYCESCYQQEVA